MHLTIFSFPKFYRWNSDPVPLAHFFPLVAWFGVSSDPTQCACAPDMLKRLIYLYLFGASSKRTDQRHHRTDYTRPLWNKVFFISLEMIGTERRRRSDCMEAMQCNLQVFTCANVYLMHVIFVKSDSCGLWLWMRLFAITNELEMNVSLTYVLNLWIGFLFNEEFLVAHSLGL